MPGRRLSGLNLPPTALAELQRDYVEGATALWNQHAAGPGAATAGAAAPALTTAASPPRSGPSNPAAAYTAQMYLLNSRTLMQMAEAVEGDAKTKARIRFAVQQWVDADGAEQLPGAQPRGAAAGAEDPGPEPGQPACSTCWATPARATCRRPTRAAFEVGRNVATTEGAVVFENELFQLIEYKPLGAKVYERPMLFVPPCINKFYIMDLQPENSLIRYTVEQGHRVFVVSWRNPDASLADKTWDDYIEHAAIRAIDVVQEMTGAKTINTLGFCVGGTILATALAVLAARGQQPAQSVTLLTTLLDFSDTGVLDLFVDEAGVQLREMTLGDKAPAGPALLKGQELATTFSFLRPNDLVWNYVVGNYLKGEAPPAFDLLYWNGDATNLPGPMYCWYLRHTYLQNELQAARQADGVRREARPRQHQGAGLHLRARARTTSCRGRRPMPRRRVMSGKKRFVLGASGPHRRRHQPAGEEEAQLLDQRHAAGRRRRLVRRRHRGAGQLVARLDRLAQAAVRRAGGGAQGAGQPQVPADRAGARPLRQAEGLTLRRRTAATDQRLQGEPG